MPLNWTMTGGLALPPDPWAEATAPAMAFSTAWMSIVFVEL